MSNEKDLIKKHDTKPLIPLVNDILSKSKKQRENSNDALNMLKPRKF